VSLKNIVGPSLCGAMLSACLIAGTAIPAHADQDDKCRHDIHRAEQNLDKAVRQHGEHSRQAEERRHQLEEVRERCHMRGERHDDDNREHR
jgi:hypothetical protein